MKRLMIIASVLLLSSCVYHNGGITKGFAKNNQNLTASQTKLQYSTDTLIIFFDKTISNEPLLQAIRDYNAEIIYHYTMMSGVAIKLPAGCDLEKSIAHFSQIKGVLSVQKDSISTIT